MRCIMKLAILMLSGLLVQPLWAEVFLRDTSIWRRAQIIEPGQQIWSAQTSHSRISDRFDSSGTREPLGAPFARKLTWGEILKNEPTAKGKAEIQSYMGERGLQEGDVAAISAYKVEREELSIGLNWAYGMMRSWMVGFQIPLRMVTTRVQNLVKVQPELGGASSAAPSAKMNSPSRVRELVQGQLRASGFDDVPERSQDWEWGDISLMSQVAVLTSSNWRWSFQQLVRFPASRNPSISEYVRSSRDDGQLDLGLTSFLDYAYGRWIFGWKVGYVMQTADRLKTREEGDGPALDLKRDLGDWLWAGVDADYKLSRRWSGNLGQSYLLKERDRFSGRELKGTDQELHQSRLTITYQVTPFSVRSRIQNKWLMSAGYAQPWIGRNSTRAGRTGLEIITYF